jgi:hypothetical protein
MCEGACWTPEKELRAKRSLPYIPQTEEYGYSCCRAISIVNAAVYYGLDVIHPEKDRKAWEMLVDAWGCRHGAAIHTNWTYHHFDLEPIPIPTEEWAFEDCLKKNIPIEISIGHKTSKKGMHSCLVIAYEKLEGDSLSLWLVNPQPRENLVQEWKWVDIDFQAENNPILGWCSKAILLKPQRRSFFPKLKE